MGLESRLLLLTVDLCACASISVVTVSCTLKWVPWFGMEPFVCPMQSCRFILIPSTYSYSDLTHNKEHGTPAVHGLNNQETSSRYDLNSPGTPTHCRHKRGTRL